MLSSVDLLIFCQKITLFPVFYLGFVTLLIPQFFDSFLEFEKYGFNTDSKINNWLVYTSYLSWAPRAVPV